MKILHVPRRFAKSDWGGTETVILETCKSLQRLGHETGIVCPRALARGDREEVEGVSVSRVSYFYPYLRLREGARREMDLKAGNLFSFQLMRALRSCSGLNLIHLHTGKRVGGIGRYVARKRGIPYVISLHGGFYDVPPEEARSWTAPKRGAFEWGRVLGWWVGSRRVLQDASAIICVGKNEEVETRRRLPGQRVLHLPNGVDPDRFARGDGKRFRRIHGIPPGARVILTVGRIDPQKNQMFLLRLMPRLLQEEPGTHLVLVGHVTSSTYAGEIAQYVRREGLERNVTILRGVDASSSELVDAYHSGDVFVLPSIHEPFGIVILEAWAAGMPILASRVGGVPSFVTHGKDGILFEPNEAKGFLEGLRMLGRSPRKARALARAGQGKARERYSWNRIVERLLEVYEEVIREKSSWQ